MNTITYNGYSLNSGNIFTTEIQQFESTLKNLNIQKFITRDGGKITASYFEPKIISLSGYIKESSGDDLDSRIDEMKKNLMLSIGNANLDIEYSSGFRRFNCSCSKIDFQRENWTIDYIQWSVEFIVSDPPFGQNTTSSTLHNELSNIFASTQTGEHSGNVNYIGSVAPYPIVRVIFNSAVGVRRLYLGVANGDGFTTTTSIEQAFSTGDVLEFNNNDGIITKNGNFIDFSGGFPNWSLSNNTYSLKIVGREYNVDLKFLYFGLWL
jgi:hypothetical protein